MISINLYSCPPPPPSQKTDFNQLYLALSVSPLKLFEIAISLKIFTQWHEISDCVEQNLLHYDLYVFIFFFRTNNLIYLRGWRNRTNNMQYSEIYIPNVYELIWNSLSAAHLPRIFM